MMLAVLPVALLLALQPGTTTATRAMQADVDRLVRAAEQLTETWPTQPPPPIPEVALVARHGEPVTPMLLALPYERKSEPIATTLPICLET